jgi:DNA invertase Pin-like site-specific DNA recombinase
MREINTVGTICLDDDLGFTYKVARLEYTEREDESFRYRFIPNYSVIDLLGPELFQGIPGLDLDLRRAEYIRENEVPVFISERTPSKNRENLMELLEECGMDYLNQLEWLIRTDSRYSGDRLYVCRYEDETLEISIDSVDALGARSAVICRRLLEYICAGRNIATADFTVSDANRKELFDLIMVLYKKEKKYTDARRRAGIKTSAANGNYRGRTRKTIERPVLEEVIFDYKSGKITGNQAAELLNISRSTFMRRLREWENAHSN